MQTYEESIDGSNLSMNQVINEIKQANKQRRKAAPIVSPSELGTPLSDVQELKLDWFWDKRILRGNVTLLDGDPDLGKSLITLDLAARVTTGQPMPDGSPGIKGNVILIAPEDDPADTIKPRILAAGGDPSRVRLLTMLDSVDPRTDEHRPCHFTLPTHLTTLIQCVQHSHAVLVIIDPLVAVLDQKISMSNDQQMRDLLILLGHLAHYYNCAILLVRHLNKGSSGNALHRGSGSIGIIASVRSSLLVTRDPYDEHKRILTVTKNNLSTKAPDLVYHITSAPSGFPTVHWLGTSYVPLPSLLKNTSELSAGRQVILNVLRDSDVPLGPKEIAERTGQKYEPMRLLLRRMVAAKEILCLAYGHYTVHGHPSLTTPPPQEQATPETLDTLEPVSLPNSNVSDTPETVETVETVETLETVEAPDQTYPLDLDTITKTIRTLFSCSHDIHYLNWHFDPRKIGCPLCDNWLVRGNVYNPTILALYEILNQHSPHENEHRHAWLERIAPFIP